MSDIIKYEYIKILDELEEVSNVFDALQEETKHLKELYNENPNDENLINQIKEHEGRYKIVYEKFVELNARAKELRALSDAETNNNK